jgi:FemAB-related protein (PEP-CTERM system-associated)
VIDVANRPTRIFSIHAADTASCAEWDALVVRERGSFCHLTAWRSIMRDVFGLQTYYLAARHSDDALAAVLPLVHIRSRLFGSFLLSMPFLNYGGPIGESAACAALSAEAIKLAGKHGVDLLELRSREIAPDGLTSKARKVITVMPLPATSQELWENGFRSKLRSQIKRAMKEEMDVRFGADQVGAFYEVFAENMRDLGVPVLPLKWFQAINRHFGDSVLFAAVYFRGVPVAAGCGFLWHGEFEMTWASSLREHAPRSPNMLLYWSMMEECIRRGVSQFNFGRSTPGASTHRFKLQWGGADATLPWGVWGEKSEPNPESAKYLALRSVWSRFPVSFSKMIGPAVARQLPL